MKGLRNMIARALRIISIFMVVGFLWACATTNPLSITLYNSKTNTLRKCAARESAPQQHTQMLAGAVEACAKQLEAHGFVRVSDSFVPPPSSSKGDGGGTR